MRQGARLLAALILLAGGQVPRVQGLDLELLAQESSVKQAVVRLTVDLNKEGLLCGKSSLRLAEEGSQQPLDVELKNCEIRDRKLVAVAAFPRSSVQREAVLEVCPGSGADCESHQAALPETAGLLTSLPLVLGSVDTARGVLIFQSRTLPSGAGLMGSVRVVDWHPAGGSPGGPPGEVTANEAGMTLTIPLGCPSLDLSRTELTRAVFEIRDSKGNPLPLSFEGALPSCGKPSGWFSLWWGQLLRTAGVVGLALVGLLGGVQIGKRRRPEPEGPPPADYSLQLSESVENLATRLERGLGELRAYIDRLKPVPTSAQPAAAGGEYEPWEPKPQPLPKLSETTGQERLLLETVNDWWARGDGDKEMLAGRLGRVGAQLYVSFDTDATLQRMVGRTFSFQPSSGPAGWVWYPLSRGEALAVPADPFLFHAGNMIEVLRLLFDGIGESPKSFRFYRVHKACRLRANPSGSATYQLLEKGFLELADRSGTRIPGPAPALDKAPSRAAALPREAAPKAPEPVVGPSLREIEDRFRLVFKEELARLQPVQMPQPVDTSREAVDALRSQVDQFSGELKKLDNIQQLLTDLARRMESLKRVPPMHMEPIVTAVKKMEPKEPPALPPPPSLPAQPAAPVAPPPPRAVTEPASGEFLRRISQALPTLLAAASEAPGSLAPSDYLRRLVQLLGVLQNLLRAQADRGWQVALVHLQVVWVSEKERMFSIHPVEICEDFREARCHCGELPEAFLLQIFLSVRYGEENLMGVAMVVSNLVERFAEGYSLLTGDDAPRDWGSVSMTRPAVLQKAKGETWRVILPMEVSP